MISRKNRALTTEDIEKITTTYHNWKKQNDNVGTGLKPVPTEENTIYQDIP
jgi:type I restriction-modification system DNA methylase subunit